MISSFVQRRRTDLKERTYQAISDLETEIKAMYSLRSRLQLSVNDALASAMRSYNKEHATHNMEDYDELANLLNIVKSAEILLQNLSVKIDSARYLQELVTILDRAMVSLRVVKSDISGMVPAIDRTLDTITNSIVEIRADLKIEEEMSAQGHACELPAIMPEVAIELPTLEGREGKIPATPAADGATGTSLRCLT